MTLLFNIHAVLKNFSMPFTLSHAILAAPISKLTANTLPIAALAIGCMVPDLIRLFSQDSGQQTHLWHSMIQPNLWIGLGFCALWYFIYRPVIYRFLGIQDALKLLTFYDTVKFLLGVIVAVLIGTATHLIWDGLTHADFRTFAFKETLSQNVHLFGQVYPLHRILQISSSILALPFLLWMSIHYYLKHQQHLAVQNRIKKIAFSLVLLSVLMGCFSVWDYARYFSVEVWHSDLYFFIGKSINEFSQGALSVFTFGCLIFLFLDRHQRLG